MRALDGIIKRQGSLSRLTIRAPSPSGWYTVQPLRLRPFPDDVVVRSPGLNLYQVETPRAQNRARPFLKTIPHGHKGRIPFPAQEITSEPASFTLGAIH